MTDYAPTTVAQSALRGIACRCPRCGKGKLYAGCLTRLTKVRTEDLRGYLKCGEGDTECPVPGQ